MRKLKRLFFLFFLLLPWLLTYSQAVMKTSAAPVIDGLADKVFQTIYPQSVTTVIDGKIDKDFNATVQLLWDAQNLYLFAHVVDPSKVNTGIGPDGKFGQDKNDHIDIMVDMDQVYPYNKTDGNGSWWNAFDNNDFQISFLRDSSFISIGGQKADSTTRSNLALAITFQTKEVPNGWNLEAKIPWNKLDASITKEALSTIGFDITVGDRDKPAADSSAIDSRVRMGSNQRGLSNLGAWFMGTFYGDPYSWLTLTLDDDSRVATEAIAPAIELFSNSPVIDGTADDIWSTISSRKVTSVIDGKLDNQFEAKTQIAWDAQNLYVFAHVTDPTKVKTGIGPDGKFGQDKNDHIDIMVDMDQVYPYNKTDGNGSWWNAFDNNDFQISFLRDSSFISIGGQKADSTTRSNLALAITFQTKEVPNGWNLEAKIPWNKLDASITKEALSTIGFDITVGDRDKPATDSSAIDSRVRMGSNQRGLSNLGAWFMGTFYGDPYSWLTLALQADQKVADGASTPAAELLTTSPLIDGVPDGIWNTISSREVTSVIDGKLDSQFGATTKLGWDAQNLYVFAHVVDPSKVNTGIGPDGKFGQDKNDHIDIMVDMDQVYPYNKTDGNGSWWNAFDNNDFQISFLRDSSFISIGGQKADSTTRSNLALAITFQTKEVPNGWNLEAKIPWNKLDASITKEALSTIGFDITVGDRDKPASDSSAIDSRVRLGSNQRGLSNLGAWFIGTFYGDPYSWENIVLQGSSLIPGESSNAGIEKVDSPPVIDGIAEPGWNTISSRKVTSVIDGKLDNQFGATTKVAWDANNLYVFTQVVDPSKVNIGIGTDGKFGQDKNDHIDIMVDMDQVYPYNKTDGNGSWWNAFDNNDFQISFLRDSSFISIGGQKADSTTRSNLALAITFQTKEVPNGWNLEAKIPWNKLDASITKEALSTIGFDITVGDRDKPATDSAAIDSRVRLGSNQRGLSNLGAWFIGTFYGDPFSWLNLTLVDSSGQIANTPKGQKVNWETEIVSTSGVVYNKGNEAITLVPTDAYIQAAEFNEKIVLSKGATFELKDAGGLVLADTDSIGDKATLVITSEDKQNSRTVTINLSPSYYITATAIGVLKPTSIVDIPAGTTVSELTAGLTLVEGSQGAIIVLASDSVSVASGNVTSSQVVKVVSLRGLNNYYTLDSYFGLNTSGIGELSLPNKFIGKISDGTTVEQLIAGLTYTADVTTVKVYTAANVELLATDAIETGNILKLSSDTKEVSYSLETIIPTVLGLVEKFDSPVDINLWGPNSAMVADNSRKIFIVTQEETALKIDMQQVAFPDGQWYSLNNFDMTDTKNRCVSFRCKVDVGMTWNGVPAATIPLQLSPWNSKKHPANRYNAVAYTIKSDGKWAFYYFDFSKTYAETPADADWSFINGLLLETVAWPNMHAGIFWLDEFRVGNEVARNANLAGIKVDGVDIANFDRDTLTYTVTLASTATTFPTIIATTEDPNASYTVVNSSDIKVSGANTVVTGISSDGTETKLYTIKYFIPDEAKDATLATLVLSEGTLTPEFNRMIMDYTVVYPIGFEALPIVTATSTVAGATVTITQFVNVRSTNVAERTATVKVTATNGTTIVNYTVVATVTLATGKSITAYSFGTPAATGTINNNSNPRKIAVTVPGATSLTALVANFTASERATVKVGTTLQVSGVTANDFTTPVDYVVTAEDGTTIKYRVTVTFPVGISESDVKVLQIYPNPSTGFIALKNISSDEISQITITSMRGQVVKLLNTYDGGLINIQELGAGVYNLSVIKKDNTLSNLRFMKQ